MFTRHVIMELKPNAALEFANVIDSKVLPLLSKQKGFRDLIAFVAPDRSEGIAISFWDTKEEAEAYNVTGYPEVLKTLAEMVQGTPRVGIAEVVTSTFQKLAVAQRHHPHQSLLSLNNRRTCRFPVCERPRFDGH